MERQIKTVWIVTVVATLFAIAGQGYWLYNQYHYSADEYAQELYKKIAALEEKEYKARYQSPARKTIQTSLSYQLSYSNDNLKTSGKVYFYDTTGQDTLVISRMSPTDSIVVSNIPSDKILFEAINRYTAELTIPLTAERMDSIFRTNGIAARSYRLFTTDSTTWESSFMPQRYFLLHEMPIVYAYNPLEKQVMTAVVSIPMNPLIKQMAGQLVLSVLLSILLTCCLIYQIRTILKQWKTDELRKSFVITMVHELKRPVQTLKMCVSFFNNKQLCNDRQLTNEVVKDAMFELDNLSAYLAKVREMTRADYEQTPLAIRTFDVCETIERLIRLCTPPVDKHVRFETYFSEQPLWINADPVHIANSLSNLIENAVKYSGTDVCIRIEAEKNDHTLILRIIDNGLGIPADEQKRIFEKFYRASNVTRRNLPGIGLGLSYVKMIIEAHGGTVGVTSSSERGTQFTLTLPQ